MRACTNWLVGCCLLCSFVAAAAPKYAVVVHSDTYADKQWRPVVEALQNKYLNVKVIEYSGRVDDALPALQAFFPRYTCFVTKPETASRAFVATVHRLTRKLDADPFPDTIWGILTGYEPADALRIAKHSEPLVVKRALSGTVGSPLDEYDEGRMYNELRAKMMWEKSQGDISKKDCPQDTTQLIVESLNDYKPDVFITSGHATEKNWQLGFSYRNGYFKCENGQLYGQNSRGQRFDVNSPNPKIHMPVGNCLIAHINDRNCMALALMRSAGVHQMVGYTIPTGYGYGGWGVKDYFSELQAGRFTLAEAHYANQAALIYNLELLGLNKDGLARGGIRGDRDVVVLYGDPAWEARMPKRELPWTQTLTEDKGVYTFTITATARGDWDNRPVVHLFDQRLRDIEIIEGHALKPVIMDNFILIKFNDGLQPMKGNRGGPVPIRGDFDKGDRFTVRFSAAKAE